MNYIKTQIAKLVAAIKAEPIVASGGAVGVVLAVGGWVQVNHIKTWQEAVALAGPIALAFVQRVFVTPNVKVALTHDDVAALSADANMRALGANPGPLPF